MRVGERLAPLNGTDLEQRVAEIRGRCSGLFALEGGKRVRDGDSESTA